MNLVGINYLTSSATLLVMNLTLARISTVTSYAYFATAIFILQILLQFVRRGLGEFQLLTSNLTHGLRFQKSTVKLTISTASLILASTFFINMPHSIVIAFTVFLASSTLTLKNEFTKWQFRASGNFRQVFCFDSLISILVIVLIMFVNFSGITNSLAVIALWCFGNLIVSSFYFLKSRRFVNQRYSKSAVETETTTFTKVEFACAIAVIGNFLLMLLNDRNTAELAEFRFAQSILFISTFLIGLERHFLIAPVRGFSKRTLFSIFFFGNLFVITFAPQELLLGIFEDLDYLDWKLRVTVAADILFSFLGARLTVKALRNGEYRKVLIARWIWFFLILLANVVFLVDLASYQIAMVYLIANLISVCFLIHNSRNE